MIVPLVLLFLFLLLLRLVVGAVRLWRAVPRRNADFGLPPAAADDAPPVKEPA